MRRARMRSRRNTGTSSSWMENSTPWPRSSVLCWLRMKATRTARGCSSSSIRKSLRMCSSPLSSSKKRADSSMSSSIASSGMLRPKCWRTQRRSSVVGDSRSTQMGLNLASSSRDSISSWNRRPLARVKTLSMCGLPFGHRSVGPPGGGWWLGRGCFQPPGAASGPGPHKPIGVSAASRELKAHNWGCFPRGSPVTKLARLWHRCEAAMCRKMPAVRPCGRKRPARPG